jgi:hypothetical protein
VHGGGHHHHSSGGGTNRGSSSISQQHRQDQHRSHSTHHYASRYQSSWFGGGSPWMHNSSFGNYYNQRSDGHGRDPTYYSSTDSIPLDYRHRTNTSSEACNRCCTALCTVCCACCACMACCAALPATVETPSRTNIRGLPYEQVNGPRRTTRSPFCPGGMFSILAFFLLLGVSVVDRSWTLNAGETRRIHKRLLNDRIHVTSSEELDVTMYSIPGSCPPLTGPVGNLEDTETLNLAKDDYQYDYFFLNSGSTIQLDVHQISGSSYVYILQGSDLLQALESDSYQNRDDFGSASLRKQFVTASGKYASASLAYTAQQSDDYILLYDNASGTGGKLTVHYNLTMTNYDLDGYKPICTSHDCTVPLGRKSCILLRANAQHVSTPKVVSVRVLGHRNWIWLVIYSATPFLVGLFCWGGHRRLQYGSKNGFQPVEDQDYPQSNPPSAAPGWSESAPVQAEAFATAPTEDFDESGQYYNQETIPIIPAENIIAMPIPSDRK